MQHRQPSYILIGQIKLSCQNPKDEGINYTMMLRKLTLLSLAPDIQKSVFNGNLNRDISLKKLLESANKLDWLEQKTFHRGS